MKIAKLIQSLALVLATLSLAPSQAQSVAKANPSKLKVAIPRTASGKPDLSGIWQSLSTAEYDLEPHHARRDAPASLGVVEGGKIPYQQNALDIKRDNFANRATRDPAAKCFMPGIPRATYLPHPFQIFQAEKQFTFVYAFGETVRTVHANGSKHPDGHIDWWMGDSRAHWEGDTLVVDVIHFNDQTWFDRAGNFHSEELHVVERYTLVGPDHIEYEATIEDPKVFTKPWKISLVLYRHKEKNFQLLEYKCYAFGLEKHYP